MENKRFLTLQEAATYLSIKQSKIYELSSRNALPGKIRFDGVVRVDRLKLEEWLEKQAAGGAVGNDA